MSTLYGTVSDRAAKTIRFNTLWQWKGYLEEKQRNKINLIKKEDSEFLVPR